MRKKSIKQERVEEGVGLKGVVQILNNEYYEVYND